MAALYGTSSTMEKFSRGLKEEEEEEEEGEGDEEEKEEVFKGTELDIDRYIRKQSRTEHRDPPSTFLGSTSGASHETRTSRPFTMNDDRYERSYDKSPLTTRRNELNCNYSRSDYDNDRSYTRSNDNTRGASLLKYEVRTYRDPSKKADYLTNDKSMLNGERSPSQLSPRSPRTDRYSSSTYTRSTTGSRSESDNDDISGGGVGCSYCTQYKLKLKTSETKLASEMDSTKILFRQKNKLEEQIVELNKKLEEELAKESADAACSPEQLEELENLKEQNEKQKGELKTLKKDLRKTEKALEEEELEYKRLKIKLEDTAFEKDRVRTELIASQLENEKLIEENEDLAVDNEDLIKERDEILQIYDELFRESERLKAEVEIWKGVFNANKGGGAGDVYDFPPAPPEPEPEPERDEGLFNPAWALEEDPSLLLPPRDDLTTKYTDPSKIFSISRDEIGRGKFGKVHKAIELKTGNLYSAKYIKVTSRETRLYDDTMLMCDVMRRLHHVRLMNVVDVYDLGSQVVVIVDHVGGGTLLERIVKKNSLTEADCKLYVQQILEGVYHMHSKDIVHLEITPENIVCINNDSMEFKLIDFGRAKQLEHKKETKITAGSPEFVAPEILSFDPVSLASDMWSIGVITYVLLSGISPFIGSDDQDTLLNVSEGEYSYDDQVFRNISQQAKSFIDGLLIPNPRERRNVVECMNHTWMQIEPDDHSRTIDLGNLKEFLTKRKEKPQVSAGRAVRRFSSFAVGPKKGPSPVRAKTNTPFLNVPTLQSFKEEEEEEEEEEEHAGGGSSSTSSFAEMNGPMIVIDDSDMNQSEDEGRSSSAEPPPTVTPFNENEGLRDYLQRMIDGGHLPGTSGSYCDQNEESEYEE